MPVITFWSNNKKAIGQTVSATLAATVMAMEHNYKILLIAADYNDNTMENCFGAQESNKAIVQSLVKKKQVTLDSGINGLLKLAESNRLTPELIHDYTKIIFKNRLEVLYPPVVVEEEKEEDTMEKLKKIILNAARYYDYVIVDLKKGIKHEQQLQILDSSNVVVLNINQGTKAIENFLNTSEGKSIIHKVVWNICRHDNKSKYNSKNLIRNILKKQSVFVTPYNTLLLDATEEETMVELLIRLKTLREDDENLTLVKSMQELIEGILMKYQELRLKM